MWLTRGALRRPITLIILVVALLLAGLVAFNRARVDILPDLDAPVVYVAQPYGGMSPAQMQGFISFYYEYHFLYVNGIESVESKSIQGASLLRLNFHPGTDMSQALAETVAYVNRARAFMPPGAVSPFVVRFDAGTLPVGYLVFSSASKTLGEIQDAALNRVRPVFGTLPGVSSPPPFGGNQRTIVLNVDPGRLQGYGLSTAQVIQGLVTGNSIQPAGVANIGDKQALVTTDSTAASIQTLLDIPVSGEGTDTVYMGDVASVADTADNPVGYALVDGKRSVYIPVTKRADASTVSVVESVRANLGRFQELLPEDVTVTYELDQSRYVTTALGSVVFEAVLGALLIGLVLFYFLRDWRASLIIVTTIPIALAGAVFALWAAGQTINIMTLGGLALSIGILVGEGTVMTENIHVHRGMGKPLARAVLDAAREVATPRLIAMACILAVFLPSLFMTGAARALFVPLSLAVAFAIGTAYILFSTLVPVLTIWLAGRGGDHAGEAEDRPLFARFRERFGGWQTRTVTRGRLVLLIYAIGAPLLLAGGASLLSAEIFPSSASRQIRLRIAAPDGTRIAVTERIAQDVLERVREAAGPENVNITLGYVGTQGASYPINLVFLWTGGPQEAVLNIDLGPGAPSARALAAELRQTLPRQFPGTSFSFEPGDLVSQILNFGTGTAVDVAVRGPSYGDVAAHAAKVRAELAKIDALVDLKYGQALRYPNIDVQIDRRLAGQLGTTAERAAQAVVSGTASSRFVTPNFWRDPKSGVSFQVQVQVPQASMNSVDAIGQLPVATASGPPVQLRQMATIRQQTVPGQLDRKNNQWLVSLTANLDQQDVLGPARAIDRAIEAAGEPPRGVTVEVRGAPTVLRQIFSSLGVGLAAALGVMLLLLVANYQSLRLALVTLASVPAGLLGAVLMLLLTGTSINLQSFMGMIMVVGLALTDSILLVTLAEELRKDGQGALDAATAAARRRLRPILMTAIAMIAGMIPMALALGEGSEATAPLGRAVIGGMLVSTAATLLVLPLIYGLARRRSGAVNPTLDPDDPLFNAPLPEPAR